MFYNRGEVLSDQFDHFKLILFWVPKCSFCKNQTKRDKVGIFRLRGGGSPVPTSTNHNTTQKVNIFVKTKNVSKVPTWKKFKHFPVLLLLHVP